MRFPGFELGSFRQHSARLLPRLLRDRKHISPSTVIKILQPFLVEITPEDHRRLSELPCSPVQPVYQHG
jgi:hypothetical protein